MDALVVGMAMIPWVGVAAFKQERIGVKSEPLHQSILLAHSSRPIHEASHAEPSEEEGRMMEQQKVGISEHNIATVRGVGEA